MRRQGMSYSSIAAATKLSANTVKSFCRREDIGLGDDTAANEYATCKNCGQSLLQTEGVKKKTFCSDKCRSDWWNRNRFWANHKQVHRQTCYYCGAEFERYGNKERKYCGRDCYIRSRYGEGVP